MKVIRLVILCALSAVRLLEAQTATGSPKPDPAKVFHSVEEMMATVPADVSFRQGRQENPAVLAPANAALAQDVYQHPATLRVRIAGIENTRSDSYEPGFIVRAVESKISRGGATIHVSLYFYFHMGAASDVAKLKKGAELTATGNIKRCQFTTSNRDVILNLDLVHCRIEAK